MCEPDVIHQVMAWLQAVLRWLVTPAPLRSPPPFPQHEKLSGAGSCSSASGGTFCPIAERLSLPSHPWGWPVTHISILNAEPETRSSHDHQGWPFGLGIKDMSCDVRQA